MQFYLDGYKPGDPDILTAELPDAVDVLIVGSGPAGALLAAQLLGVTANRTLKNA
jgi:phenol 2-monooxygenase (NADPH)